MVLETKRYVITGGSCTGKTTTIRGLLREFNRQDFSSPLCAIIEEAAQAVISEQAGAPHPILPETDFFGFQSLVFARQQSFERDYACAVGKKLAEYQTNKRIDSDCMPYFPPRYLFFDRTVIDQIAYYKDRNSEAPRHLRACAERFSCDAVFFLERLPLYEQTAIRKESQQDSERVHEIIRNEYAERGFRMISVPSCDDVRQRISFIKAYVEHILPVAKE